MKLVRFESHKTMFFCLLWKGPIFEPQKILHNKRPYRDFVILIIFLGGISRKIITEFGFELNGTRRSDLRRVGRSIGMRHLLGNCVRLVTGPARSSRSQGAWAACGGRSQKKKSHFDRLVRFISTPPKTRICFACVAQLAAAEQRLQHTHAMAAKVILSLMTLFSPFVRAIVDARVLCPSCVSEQPTRIGSRSVVATSIPHISLYNASEV